MKASVIRQKWLDFFEEKGHRVEPSAPLVPHNDPSLLWINAGMAPLKAYFDGRVQPENPRITNAQKCIRTNDIENVGKTRRHHTFFEMLGNFSIGDYFKEEVITWAWEFLTGPQWLGFAPERLSVTVYKEDQEAYDLWHEKIGIPEERIYKLDKDNFWDIGEGPCGPCTEIFYDRGDNYGDLSDPECWPGGENERFLEVWNLVFSQFNHNKDGSYTPLPNKNIDTGAGLERFATILQDVDSNFDTDLFAPIIAEACRIIGVEYKVSEQQDIALKVIADHVRTVSFAVGDGVLPSNEGRGYIIRRLLRRAVRFGKNLGMDKPFLYQLVGIVGDIMGVYYPEVVEKREYIERIVRLEEERFHETLGDGLAILSALVETAKKADSDVISGADAFKLYDTYGFPFDLTEDFAFERGLSVDREGFDVAMNEQRVRARSARQETESMKIQGGPLSDYKDKSLFVGYNEMITQASVMAIVHNNQMVELVSEGEECSVILNVTPFYAESGGQVSDKGFIENDLVKAVVTDVAKAPHGQHVMSVRIESGTLKLGDTVVATLDRTTRQDIVKNHTATHLLHKALKEVLGDHVNQAGSLVTSGRLRFDFSHFGSVTAEEIKDIENRVNRQIWLNTELLITQKSIDEAKAMGATALFGEKYGDVVRVVRVGDYSIELCGGCHVGSTAEIGLFKIVSESGIGSGVRRMEAVTGRHAYDYVEQQLELLEQSATLMKTSVQDVPKRVEGLLGQLRDSNRENDSLKSKLMNAEAGSLTDQIKEIAGIQVLSALVDAPDIDALRSVLDQVKGKVSSGIIVLGAGSGDKVNLIAMVTPDLIAKGYHAGKIVKAAAVVCGGGGGGRPDMAQAGGKDASKLAEALLAAEAVIAEQAREAL